MLEMTRIKPREPVWKYLPPPADNNVIDRGEEDIMTLLVVLFAGSNMMIHTHNVIEGQIEMERHDVIVLG